MNGPNFVSFSSHDKRISLLHEITRSLDTSLQMSQLYSHARRNVKMKCGIHNFLANLESYYEIRFVIFALQVET